MKTASVIARYLAGLIFLVMGLNGFLHFIPFPPPPGVAGQFMGALYVLDADLRRRATGLFRVVPIALAAAALSRSSKSRVDTSTRLTHDLGRFQP